MRKTRTQWRSIVEWVVAAGLLVGATAVGLNLFGEIRRVAPVAQVIALEPDAPVPPSIVPPRAVSVPLLPLTRNLHIEVGERAADVLARLRDFAELTMDAVERRLDGTRITREFRHAGGRFYLVTEAAGGGDQRVTAIFIP